MRFVKTLVILICILPFGLAVQNAHAAGGGYMHALEQLRKINTARPEQNGRHLKAAKVLSGRVLDKTNRVVGEVRNVILDRNGAMKMLEVDFNRLNLGVESLMVDYNALGARPATNGYKISRTDDQIAAMLPELLAATQTAAGEGQNEMISLKNLTGKTLYRTGGDKIGTIRDVLFDSTGARAELLLVELNQRSVRNEVLAVPFTVTDFQSKRIVIRDSFAEAMIDYAKTN